jgi:hypothetical protein
MFPINNNRNSWSGRIATAPKTIAMMPAEAPNKRLLDAATLLNAQEYNSYANAKIKPAKQTPYQDTRGNTFFSPT